MISSQTQHKSMQNFDNDSKQPPIIDSHPKESNETKLDSYFEIPPLTPQLLFVPLRQQSIILKECFTTKADPDNHFLWKLVAPENYWHIISSVYFPRIEESHFKQIERTRDIHSLQHHSRLKKEIKPQIQKKERSEIQDKVFIYQTRMLASNQLAEPSESIDQIIRLWENERKDVSNQVHLQLSMLQSHVEDQKLEIDNLNRMIYPAVYRSDLTHFQYMEIEDIEARRGSEDLAKKERQKVICCVCNYAQIEDCVFLQCNQCKNVIHDKCYLVNLDLSQEQKKQFVCWSCFNPDPQNYNSNKCALCSIQGGIMAPSELKSNHQFVVKKYHPLIMYDLESNENEFTITKRALKPDQIVPFNVRVHLCCAFWHNQCFYNRETNQLQGLLKIKDKKWKSVCRICEQGNGAVIDCNHSGCVKSYHPECARQTNIYMSLIRLGKLSKQTFCNKHRIKYAHEKIVEKRLQNLHNLKKLYLGIEKSLGYQGFYEKRQSKASRKSHHRSRKRSEVVQKQDGQKRFCICRQVDTGQLMIECQLCFQWFHFQCVKIKNTSHFVCPICKPK